MYALFFSEETLMRFIITNDFHFIQSQPYFFRFDEVLIKFLFFYLSIIK